MTFHDHLATERRARLAAERLLEQKQAELEAANRKISAHALSLVDEIVVQQCRCMDKLHRGCQADMPLTDALRTYSLLSIGDGLVTQIPALLVSTASGIIVTRAASESNMGADLTSQLTRQPRAILVAGLVVWAVLSLRIDLFTDVLKEVLDSGDVKLVVGIGPVPMMKFVSKLTAEYKVPTLVSLNPIMVDGTGMCGGCRVSIGGKNKFACVDGPEFDGHQVDYDELMQRLQAYCEDEKACHDGFCKIRS